MSKGPLRRPRDLPNIRTPNIRLPRLSVPRNPRGWGSTNIDLRSRGLAGAGVAVRGEPAGEPPSNWGGTRPEWSIYWALNRLGLVEGEDFVFQAQVPGTGVSYYSQVDFLVNSHYVGIDVQ